MSDPETFEAHIRANGLFKEVNDLFREHRILLSKNTHANLLAIFTRHICSAHFAGRDDFLRLLSAELRNPESRLFQSRPKS
jgi:hypothetical protein